MIAHEFRRGRRCRHTPKACQSFSAGPDSPRESACIWCGLCVADVKDLQRCPKNPGVSTEGAAEASGTLTQHCDQGHPAHDPQRGCEPCGDEEAAGLGLRPFAHPRELRGVA
jgi:hypothetical protein